jgi:hypothetical protein
MAVVSYITDVVVISSKGEDEAIAFINKRLEEHDSRKQQIRPLDIDAGGGCKVPGIAIHAACFNYLPRAEFVEAVREAPWRVILSVAVYIDDESGDTYVFSPARSDEYMITEADERGALWL